MKTKHLINISLIWLLSVSIFAQNKDSYSNDNSGTGFFDLSRLSVHHSLGFGMGTSSGSNVQSEGIYSTMLCYKFSPPLTLKVNLGLPIFSTFSPYQNLNQQNITSTEYFKNMPVEASLSWKPSANFSFHFTMSRSQYNNYSGMNYPWYSRSMFDNSLTSSEESD